MKQTPDLDRAQARMQPGEITLHGFLGDDTRRLADIIVEDAETVRRLGLEHGHIAARLAELTEAGRHLLEQEVEVEGRYRVTVRDDRGVLPSPFGDGRFEKGDTRMTDPVTGRTLRWNGLTLHMIADHGFYGGKGSDYRIDPAAAAETLHLTPDGED